MSQTYTDFEYIVVDNGSDDGSSEIMERYARLDPRIKLIRHDVNKEYFWIPLVQNQAAGEYLTVLDSDDWWEPDYLERLLAFAEEEQLDIACTGTTMHMADGTQSFRQTKRRLVLFQNRFAEGLPWYHAFFRTTWGKLVRMEVIQRLRFDEFPRLGYSGDTIYCFQLLRHANCIGIDNTILHHYRIHRKSVSYQYNPKRFKADIYLYNDAIDFLSAYGPISVQNRNFLQAVYSNAVIDTSDVIHNSTLSPMDKLQEYRTIALHPLTQAAYKECTNESAEQSRKHLIHLALLAGTKLGGQDDTDFRAVMQALLPRCGQAVTRQSLSLFVQEQDLLLALLQDNLESLLRRLLALIAENRYVKKYDMSGIVKALAVDKPLLCQIEDAGFLRKYGDIYLKVWRNETLPALEEMTGLLLEGSVSAGKESFLQLYISLAALEEQVPAFIFGKLQLAWLYLQQDRRKECHAIADELTEIGLESEELSELRQELEAGS